MLIWMYDMGLKVFASVGESILAIRKSRKSANQSKIAVITMLIKMSTQAKKPTLTSTFYTEIKYLCWTIYGKIICILVQKHIEIVGFALWKICFTLESHILPNWKFQVCLKTYILLVPVICFEENTDTNWPY